MTDTQELYDLQREHWIARPIDEVFRFFSDARNLERITPPWLGFHILTPGPIEMRAGTKIKYRLSLHGIPVTWTTEIELWEPPFCFVDSQLSGPYKVWHHTHTFQPRNDGTLMTDTVRYQLPFGPIGKLVHKLKVRGDVLKIFDYRNQQIDRLFKTTSAAAK